MTGLRFQPKILRNSGRRELKGVKSTAHVAGFDGLILRSFFASSVRASATRFCCPPQNTAQDNRKEGFLPFISLTGTFIERGPLCPTFMPSVICI